MGRRDEAQAATFAAVETMKAKVREDQKALFERLKGVPLSELTVSDMVAIVQCLTRGHKIDYHANVPWEGDVAMLEKIAKRIGR